MPPSQPSESAVTRQHPQTPNGDDDADVQPGAV
jgi:hypothetical protein